MTAGGWICLISPLVATILILLGGTRLTRRAAGWYQQFLRRPATTAELNNNVAALQRGTTDQQLIANIIGSPEYEQLAIKNATS